jgi:hypothetical protein
MTWCWSKETALLSNLICTIVMLTLTHGQLTVGSTSARALLNVMSQSAHSRLTVSWTSAHSQLMVGSWSAQSQKLYSLPAFKWFCLYQGWRSLHKRSSHLSYSPKNTLPRRNSITSKYSLETFWIIFKKKGLSPSAAWVLYQISWSWSHRVGCRSCTEVCTFQFKTCS